MILQKVGELSIHCFDIVNETLISSQIWLVLQKPKWCHGRAFVTIFCI